MQRKFTSLSGEICPKCGQPSHGSRTEAQATRNSYILLFTPKNIVIAQESASLLTLINIILNRYHGPTPIQTFNEDLTPCLTHPSSYTEMCQE
jgi:hypothetical protein